MPNQIDVLMHGQSPNTSAEWNVISVSAAGVLSATPTLSTGQTILDEPGDGKTPINNANIPIIGWNELFNGATYDRQRGNTEQTVLANAARTATNQSADFTNYNARGLHLVVNVVSITGTPSITPAIQGKDPISGNYYDILIGTPITGTGTTVLKVYPGISAVVNSAASDILPRTWRLNMTHATADSITYSVAGMLVI